MRQEAEAHASDDKKRRDLIEAKNTADNAIYGAEKVLSENNDKVPDELKAEVRLAIDEVKKVKDGEDEPAIHADGQLAMAPWQGATDKRCCKGAAHACIHLRPERIRQGRGFRPDHARGAQL